MLQAVDKGQDLIGLEHALVTSEKGVESHHIARFDGMHDLVVGEEVLLEVFLVEHLPVRDLSHEELDDDQKFRSVNTEASSANFRSLTKRLDECSLSLGVLELNSLYTSLIVQVSRVLVV